MIILDTNVVSELLRADPAEPLLTWHKGLSAGEIYLTSITRAEMRYGVARLPAGRRRDRLDSSV